MEHASRTESGASMFDYGSPPDERRGIPAIILTPRDRVIIELLADGKTDDEIGAMLSITGKTVNYHVESIKRRFGVHTRIQVVATALRRRYIY